MIIFWTSVKSSPRLRPFKGSGKHHRFFGFFFFELIRECDSVCDVLFSLGSPLRSLFQRRPCQDTIINYRVSVKHKGRYVVNNVQDVEFKAVAFSLLDGFLKRILIAPREIKSLSCRTCWMFHDQGAKYMQWIYMIWIVTFLITEINKLFWWCIEM